MIVLYLRLPHEDFVSHEENLMPKNDIISFIAAILQIIAILLSLYFR